MREPSDPVPGTGRHGKGGSDRSQRIKHGAAPHDPKQEKIERQHSAALRRRARGQ